MHPYHISVESTPVVVGQQHSPSYVRPTSRLPHRRYPLSCPSLVISVASTTHCDPASLLLPPCRYPFGVSNVDSGRLLYSPSPPPPPCPLPPPPADYQFVCCLCPPARLSALDHLLSFALGLCDSTRGSQVTGSARSIVTMMSVQQAVDPPFRVTHSGSFFSTRRQSFLSIFRGSSVEWNSGSTPRDGRCYPPDAKWKKDRSTAILCIQDVDT